VGNAVYAEQLLDSSHSGSQITKISASDNGRILSEKDYRFFLLRHSSLFESMVHSNYIASKLQIWTNKGMHKLQELLAKMGYPLEECRQPYAFMKPTLKRRLRDQIATYAEVSPFFLFPLLHKNMKHTIKF
jgi:cell division control protein 45